MPLPENNLSTSGDNGPNLWTSPNGDDQFGVWCDSNNNIRVTHFKRSIRRLGSGGSWNMSTLAGNPLGSPIWNDGHESPAICVDGNGRVHVAHWTQRGVPPDSSSGPDHLPRLVRTTNPLDLHSWTDEINATYTGGAQTLASGIRLHPDQFAQYASNTYWRFSPFSDGAVFCTHRGRYLGGSSGPGFIDMYYRGPAALAWTYLGQLTAGDRADINLDVAGSSAMYLNQAFIDENDRIHQFGTWRLNFAIPSQVYTDQPSYCYSDDRGNTWKSINGTVLTTPFSYSDASGIACRTGIDFGGCAITKTNGSPTIGSAAKFIAGMVDSAITGSGIPGGNLAAVTTNGTTSITASSGTFTASMVGATINGHGLTKAGSTIVSVAGGGASAIMADGASDSLTGPMVFYTTIIAVATSSSATLSCPATNSTAITAVIVGANAYTHGAAVDANGYPCSPFSSSSTAVGGPGGHIVRWTGSAWTSVFQNTYGGGQAMNLVWWKNDLWQFARLGLFIQLRRVGSPNEVVNVASPVHGIIADPASDFPPPRYCFPDPVALMKYGSVEILVTEDDNPRVFTFGDGKQIIGS